MIETLSSPFLTAHRHGGKAFNISQLLSAGLPSVDGFVIPTNMTFRYDFGFNFNLTTDHTLYGEISSQIRYLAEKRNESWSDELSTLMPPPLIVSVRSGARVSMPGMMDTILNVGLTRNNIDTFVAAKHATRSFGLDCYRRLIQMFGVTVKGIDAAKFTEIYDAAVLFYGELEEESYEDLASIFEKIYEDETGEVFPQSIDEQLCASVNAVFKSYFSEKAVAYRAIENLDTFMGTAVTVQPMIFGNLDSSATGVAFTHNPNTGERGAYGEFLKSAQGEDVVAGTHKVNELSDMASDPELGVAYKELLRHLGALYEKEKDILDVEFTIERGQLYLLQYRVAKRSNRASIRCILDQNRDGEISAESATKKFLDMLPKNDNGIDATYYMKELLGVGLGVTDGIVSGSIVCNKETAKEYAEQNKPYILVARETNPNDVEQMKNSVGILTATGGSLSHAAVVARGWQKSCVVSFPNMYVHSHSVTINDIAYQEGDFITINGETGEVYRNG